ncbi:hypothetical protein GPALN_006106 [Globodera pallida]|nr:hypothetical protein GPALN_006106 [Globodera pallida]
MAWQFDENGTRYKIGRVTAGHNHPENDQVREANERICAEADSDFSTTSRNIVPDRQGWDVVLDVLPTTEIIIPNELQQRPIFNQIVGHNQRMIVFCSAFVTSPRGFTQLYTMSVIIDHCANQHWEQLVACENYERLQVFSN